ncbi:MAG: hypothetical protein ABL958_08155 [Bdellovibrionia bacterium]
MKVDTTRTLMVLGFLAVMVFFSSISIPEPSAILLAQIPTDQITASRTLLKTSGCESGAVDAIQIEADQDEFSVHHAAVGDAHGGSELLIWKSNRKAALALERSTCVDSIELAGTVKPAGGKRSFVRVWGLKL